MDMVPQAYRLECQKDGKFFRVIGWTDDTDWTKDVYGELCPVVVPVDRAGRPEVLTGQLYYHVPLT